MATEYKKEPVLILRMDGEDLKELVESTQFEPEASIIFSQLDQADGSLHKCLTVALGLLSVDHGMPPSSDPWVYGNIVEPALQSLSSELDEPISQETFFEKFQKLVNNIAQCLHDHPVIVAHSENTFDGSAIRRLLSNRFELNKLLNGIWRDLPKDQSLKAPKEYFLFALDKLSTSTELPPCGTHDQVDAIVNGVIEMANVDDSKIMSEQAFKKEVTEILQSLSLRLGANPIIFSSNSVIDEPLASSSPPTPAQSE